MPDGDSVRPPGSGSARGKTRSDVSRDPRRTTVWAILGVLLLFGAGAVISMRLLLGGEVLPAGDRVALLPLRGAIVDEEWFLGELEHFRDDGGVRAFVIEIESPGGAVGASQSIYDALRDLRDGDDRPVIAWMGDVAASGGYYAAMGADSVLALPGTITGSIGVIMEFPNAEELLRNVGLGWEIVKSGEHKDMGNPTHALGAADRAILQALVDDVYGQFVDVVTENRPLGRSEVERLADGRVFSGRQAVELGLVDRLGTLDDAIAVAGRMAGLGEEPRLQHPRERRFGLWDLVWGLTDTEARGLLNTLVPMHSGTPRLLYEWK